MKGGSVLLLLLLLFVNAALAGERERVKPRVIKAVDLRNAEELAWLKQHNPSHYEKVQKILYAHKVPGKTSVTQWMRVHMKATEIDHSHITLTSLPPKTLLKFVLDDTRYTAIVVVD